MWEHTLGVANVAGSKRMRKEKQAKEAKEAT